MTAVHDKETQTDFGLHSVFARLFISVFLALIVFAVAMVILAQLTHNNSDSMRSRVIAGQIISQIDPMLAEVDKLNQNNRRVQSRFVLAIIKKSFDIMDDSLNAKIGLYDQNRRLIIQTEDSNLPPEIRPESSWLAEIFPKLIGGRPPHVTVKSITGYTLWYENRNPPKESPLLAVFNLFTGTILLLTIMSAVLWRIAHSITWRINQMSHQMAKLGDGDFSVRVSEHGNDEIAMLAYGFNQSAQKIEQLINAHSLLLAHASHEFRTPITRIRLQVEMMDMLAQKLGDDDKAKFDKRAVAINRDLTGLNDLVESILLVSRLDAGHALQNAERVDLYELVHTECQHYPEATLFALPINITAQPKLLTHLVRNLLNNAMIHGIPPIQVYLYHAMTTDDAHTIPQALLELDDDGDKCLENTEKDESMDKPKHTLLKRLARKDKTRPDSEPNYAVLAVIDQGEGIPPEKREDIFSPFVRLKQEKKGSGLGLSLVSQITEAHQGQILTDTWQGKTRFLVILPAKPKSKLIGDKPKADP
ncbi:MAG: ATP-binding protein [Moraxella sp.]|nr:ATP-binding protein [Moraxella sp.]